MTFSGLYNVYFYIEHICSYIIRVSSSELFWSRAARCEHRLINITASLLYIIQFRVAVGMGWEWESYLSYGNYHCKYCGKSYGNPVENPMGNPMGIPMAVCGKSYGKSCEKSYGNPVENPMRNPVGNPVGILWGFPMRFYGNPMGIPSEILWEWDGNGN